MSDERVRVPGPLRRRMKCLADTYETTLAEWLKPRLEAYVAEAKPPPPTDDPIPDDVFEALDSLTDEQRLNVFSRYCTHCGSRNPRCQCMNDE